MTNRPKFLRRYKIQPNTNEPVDSEKLLKVIAQVVFNQIFVGIPFTILSYNALRYRGPIEIREIPSATKMLFDISICILVEELGFYYSHRFLHSK